MDRIEKLKRLKKRERLSYERLARLVDVSFMSLYRWIKMGMLPRNRGTIRKLDRFLSRRVSKNGSGWRAPTRVREIPQRARWFRQGV